MALVALGVSACDPCSLVPSCGQAPRISVVGQIVDDTTGVPVRNARVVMVVDSGVTALVPSAAAVTGGNGTFELELPMASLGHAYVTFSISSPGKPTYRIPGIHTSATVLTGDALVLRPWVSAFPALQYVIELYRDGTNDERVADARVDFRRTDGARMFANGVEIQSVTGVTNDVGWIFPFRGVTTDEASVVVGDLVVHHAPGDSAIIAGLRFPALATFSPGTGLVRLGIPADP